MYKNPETKRTERLERAYQQTVAYNKSLQSRPEEVKKKPKLQVSRGYVYILHCIGTNFYKIGVSQHSPEGRLATLQVGNPYELQMSHCVKLEDYGAVENQLHGTFESKRIRGEWFKLGKDDLIKLENVLYFR